MPPQLRHPGTLVSYATGRTDTENQAAHAVEYPTGNPAKAGPAGLGAIAPFWSPRLELAGKYDAHWDKSKKPLLPDDYDERFALSAPADQRSARSLRGGETVTLVNLTPEGALRFELPRVLPCFRTRFGARVEEHPATLTTVFMDTEVSKLSLVWQSSLRVRASELEYLDDTTIEEKPFP